MSLHIPNRDSRPPGILDTIGNTPLVRLDRFLDRKDVHVLGKLEMANPGGSSKDRPVLRMLRRALAEGRVRPGGLVVESSSGNTAIAMAQFCNLHELRFRCVVDRRTQRQHLLILQALGAEVEFIEDHSPDPSNSLPARFRRVEDIVRATKGAYWPNQHSNPDNPAAHETGTMREIHEALGGHLDYLFVALSTTGTALGCQRFLRRVGSGARIVAIDAIGSAIFGSAPAERPIPGLGAGIAPPLARGARFDAVERVSALDCVVGCRRLARRESILAGGSSGGVLQALRRCSSGLPSGSVCVVILADGGTNYLDTVFDDQWVDEVLGCGPDELSELVREPDSELDLRQVKTAGVVG